MCVCVCAIWIAVSVCVCAIWIAIFHMNDNTLFIGLPSCEEIFHYTKKSLKTLCVIIPLSICFLVSPDCKKKCAIFQLSFVFVKFVQ